MQKKFILNSVADTLIGKPVHRLTIPIQNPGPPTRVIVKPAEPIIIKQGFWSKLFRRDPAPIKYTEEVVEFVEPEMYKSYEIRPCVVANMYRVAGHACLLSDGLFSQQADNLKFVADNLPEIVYIAAAAIQNNHLEPEKELIDFLEKNLDAEDLYKVLKAAFSSLRMDSFTNSIVLMKGTVGILDPETSPTDGSE